MTPIIGDLPQCSKKIVHRINRNLCGYFRGLGKAPQAGMQQSHAGFGASELATWVRYLEPVLDRAR
jgi:hypothetical protein